MSTRHSLPTRTAVAALLTLVTFAASCREAAEPTAPPIRADKGAGNPTVTSVMPDSSIRGVTLDITVKGAGFSQGSAVTLERGGTPAAGITTNSTTFVTGTELIANITIAATADTGRFDVAVITLGGRKGVGIELFAVEYEIAELGILGGTWSIAHAINDRGEVVGASCTQECLGTAFYWSQESGQVDLGGLPGYTRSGAYAINSRGQVFGAVECWGGDPACGGEYKSALVRWDRVDGNWTITPMEGCSIAMPLSDDSQKFLINNNDLCVKRKSFSLVVQTVSGGTVANEVSLPSLFEDGSDWANAISDAPMVAGVSYEVLERFDEYSARTGWGQPVVWYRDATGTWVILPLGFPSSDLRAWATDIGEPDAAGRVRVTGYTEFWDGAQKWNSIRAVRWTLQADGLGGWVVSSMEILPGSGHGDRSIHEWAIAINDAGDIVGTAGDYLENGIPVKWPAGGGIERLPVENGGVMGAATDINNLGWVVGTIWDNRNNCERAAIWRLW